MKDESDHQWGAANKKVSQVIKELHTFEDQELTVMVSSDGGQTFKPVKLIGKGFANNETYCTLFID
jgi:hypothetical protein